MPRRQKLCGVDSETPMLVGDRNTEVVSIRDGAFSPHFERFHVHWTTSRPGGRILRLRVAVGRVDHVP